MEQCHSVLAKQDRAQWILECDICRCFDDISHDWLLQNVPMNKAVLRKWLKAGYIETGRLHATSSGTPKGGIISSALANWCLDTLQTLLALHFKNGWKKDNGSSIKSISFGMPMARRYRRETNGVQVP
ncbi:reverse transcriptase domain-containing protein [Candidatus Williamhamiltonella defendens]|uniref:reverse transcriptase domain-containing protein n=1 Tax=Candidatus Williamhamiltonella defendens TaxID=138072 RepID=UPI0020C707AA|nr:reverse transcriptase domain-containing protein [Candidatus Hamiltonella defensa]